MNNYAKKMRQLVIVTILCCAVMIVACVVTGFFHEYAVGAAGNLLSYESAAYMVIPLVACILWISGNYRSVVKGNILPVREQNASDCKLILVGWILLAVFLIMQAVHGSSVRLAVGWILIFYLPITIWGFGVKHILAAQK